MRLVLGKSKQSLFGLLAWGLGVRVRSPQIQNQNWKVLGKAWHPCQSPLLILQDFKSNPKEFSFEFRRDLIKATNQKRDARIDARYESNQTQNNVSIQGHREKVWV